MTQEDKDLLIKDLCARLPYGVRVQGNFKWGFDGQIMDDMRESVLDIETLEWSMNGIEVRPYLRPMSSMTEEEGMGIYATNDKEGKYFPDRFFVDTCINGNYQSNYFSRESNAYYWLSKITEGKVKTKEEVEAFNEDVDRDPDDFIYVHEYRIIN